MLLDIRPVYDGVFCTNIPIAGNDNAENGRERMLVNRVSVGREDASSSARKRLLSFGVYPKTFGRYLPDRAFSSVNSFTTVHNTDKRVRFFFFVS